MVRLLYFKAGGVGFVSNFAFRLSQYRLLERIPVGSVLRVNTQKGFQYEIIKVGAGRKEEYRLFRTEVPFEKKPENFYDYCIIRYMPDSVLCKC